MTRLKDKKSRAERRRERRERRKLEENGTAADGTTVVENAESSEDKIELSVDRIVNRERTSQANEEGYHFVRPEWHRYVYGGGKKDK